MKFKKKKILGGAALSREYGCSAQKGNFCIPEFRKHSLKIWCESFDNYYLLAFTENLKNSPNKQHFIFLLRNKQKI